MELWMTASATKAQLAGSFRAAQHIIEDAFHQRFVGNDYGNGVIELQHHVLLHSPKQRVSGESKRFLKMSHTAMLSSRVAVPEACTTELMVERLAISLMRGFERLKSLAIKNFDVERFSADFAQFAVQQGWIVGQQKRASPARRQLNQPALALVQSPTTKGNTAQR